MPLSRKRPNFAVERCCKNMYTSSDVLDIYYLAICIKAKPLLGNRCLDRV